MLAKAMIIITSPMPITVSTPSVPNTHQTAFDFFAGGAAAGGQRGTGLTISGTWFSSGAG
jgi:hypothetical protein